MYNNILVDFDSLIDTDLGLLRLIKNEYNNPKYLDSDYLNNVEYNVLVYSLVKRENENPLTLVVKDNYIDSIEELRNQFFRDDYKKILKQSGETNLVSLIKQYIYSNQIDVTVLCKNKEEEAIIKNIYDKIKIIVENNYSNISIDKYDCLFFKRAKDLLKLKNVKVKNIYICNYNFNLQKNSDKLIDLEGLEEVNEIYIIDAYDTNINALG